MYRAALPNLVVFDQGAPASGAAGPASAAGSALGRPPTARRARPTSEAPDQERFIGYTRMSSTQPVFLGPDCPARGHRIKGGPHGAVVRDRLNRPGVSGGSTS
jgi:hypothetical protein